ncbi:MAG: HDOD domain-containing protein, partial [Sedimenticola sp.]|nr:HDOD domain-containing protein [Sedimenticola sp.]
KDQAMLAGLIHNIGALPILTWAETSYPELMEDEAALDSLLDELTPDISALILNAWGFAETLEEAARESRNLQYDGGQQADYVDVVIVARLQSQHTNEIESPADWLKVPAFLKVGLDPEIELIEIEGVAEDIESVQGAFL